jgi:hypothetical protein
LATKKTYEHDSKQDLRILLEMMNGEIENMNGRGATSQADKLKGEAKFIERELRGRDKKQKKEK